MTETWNINDPVLTEDLEDLAAFCHRQNLSGKTFFITGATGLIGSQIGRALLLSNKLYGDQIKVAAFVRSREKAEALYDGLTDGLAIVTGDIADHPDFDGDVDYIIHTASPTGSKYFVSHPVETIHAAIDGTDNMLRFAKEKAVSAFLYLSSLEVYGTPDPDQNPMPETGHGYIDSTNVRSSYSEGKRIVECLCASYAQEYGVPSKIARLAQTFGPGVRYDDGRVFAEFARCVIEKKDISLHTQGRTVRNYCYTRDAVKGLLTVLLHGSVGEAYNVANPETACSIREMADLTASLNPEGSTRVCIDIPDDVSKFGYNPEMIIRLDPSKLEALGWKAEIGIKEMFERLIASMKAER